MVLCLHVLFLFFMYTEAMRRQQSCWPSPFGVRGSIAYNAKNERRKADSRHLSCPRTGSVP